MRRCGSSSHESTSSRSDRARSDSSTAAAARRAWEASKASRPASAPAAAEQVQGPAVAGGIDQLDGPEGGFAVGGGVGEAVLLPAQGGLLVGILEVGGGDLLDLVAQDVGLTGALLGVAPRPASASSTACSWLRIARTRLRSVPAKASRTLRAHWR